MTALVEKVIESPILIIFFSSLVSIPVSIKQSSTGVDDESFLLEIWGGIGATVASTEFLPQIVNL